MIILTQFRAAIFVRRVGGKGKSRERGTNCHCYMFIGFSLHHSSVMWVFVTSRKNGNGKILLQVCKLVNDNLETRTHALSIPSFSFPYVSVTDPGQEASLQESRKSGENSEL